MMTALLIFYLDASMHRRSPGTLVFLTSAR